MKVYNYPMGTGELTFWTSGIWLIPLFLLATIGGLYILVRFWRSRTIEELKEMRGDLRRSQVQRREFESAAGYYSQENREPYGSLVVELRTRLEDIDKRISGLQTQHVAIQEEIRRLSSSSWQATIGAPYYWFLLRQQVNEQKNGQAELLQALAASEAAVQKLADLPFEAADRARKARALHQQLSRLLESLQSKKVHGDTFEKALSILERQSQALQGIPERYYRGEAEGWTAQAGVVETADVFQTLTEVMPVLEKDVTEAQAWEKAYQQAAENVVAMRQSLSSLGTTLDALPPGLELDALQKRFSQLTVIAHNLNATLERMEIESLSEVAREARRVQETAGEIEKEVKSASDRLVALERLLPQVTGDQRTLSAQFSSLGTHEVHPVAWESSRARLTEISRQLREIGPAQKARTPVQVVEDLRSLQRLQAEQKKLSARFQQVAEQHDELVGLLNSEEYERGREWLNAVKGLARRAGQYAAENWPQEDAAGQLPADLDRLEAEMDKLVFVPREEPISEDVLGQRLAKMQALDRSYEELRERIRRVRDRLEEILATERATEDDVENTRAILRQLSMLVRSNPFLAENATKDLERRQSVLARLSDELADHSRGSIVQKSEAVHETVERLEGSVRGWLERMEKEIAALMTGLAEKRNKLLEAGDLDEPAMAEADRLLAEAGTLACGQVARSPGASLEAMLAELKRCSDFWQSASAATNAFDDFAETVLNSNKEANELRQYTRDYLADLEAWLQSNRGWPPTTMALHTERQELARLEEQWQALKTQRLKAIALVAQLGSLANRYHSVIEKLQQKAERAAEEHEKIDALDQAVNELTGQWQQLGQAYRENELAADAISRLLDETGRYREAIERQARQGQKSYQQTLEALDGLQKKLRRKQVPVDDHHVMDVSGRQISYR